MIREEKTYQIPSAMQIGKSLGMQTFDDALKALLAAGRITGEAAYRAAAKKEEFRVVPARRRPRREEGVSTETPKVAPKIDRFLRLMTSRGASDFHLNGGRPPMLRVSGAMEAHSATARSSRPTTPTSCGPSLPPACGRSSSPPATWTSPTRVPGLARFRVKPLSASSAARGPSSASSRPRS